MSASNTIKHNGKPARRAFSLTELLVVIGIIVLLVGLLLVALGQVQKKARRTRTEAIMNQFANACMAFQAEHGMYPGVIPDDVLRMHEVGSGGLSPISSTENALLHLMGGYRVLSPSDEENTAVWNDYQNFTGTEITFLPGTPNEWKLKINVQRIGEGPWINSKPYAPYFTPGPDDLVAIRNGYDEETGQLVSGQVGEPSEGFIPDLVDAWGQPIIYLRQARNRGPLVEDTLTASAPRPQFLLCGTNCFLQSASLAEAGKKQSKTSILGDDGTNALSNEQKMKVFSAILSHATFYKSGPPPTAPLYGTARGAIVLLSAGADGVYFSRFDGPRPVQPNDPIDASNVQDLIIDQGPKVFDDPSTGFDDVRIYGGG